MTDNDDVHEAPGSCPVCGAHPAVDGRCEHCGRLDWFAWENQGDVHVLTPFGHLLHAEPIQAFIDAYQPAPGTRLVIDLSRAQYISSAALSKLLTLRKRLLSRDGRIALRAVHPDLWEVFQVTRLDTYFEIEK